MFYWKDLIEYLLLDSFLEVNDNSNWKMLYKKEVAYYLNMNWARLKIYTFININEKYDYNSDFLFYVQIDKEKTANILKLQIPNIRNNFVDDFEAVFRDFPIILEEYLM